ncbi:deoxynucleoside kinase [Acidaminobacter sp. JC074]|uniref:deoxynucleoside kinase n=1 Tax=Acidaminobacter sp. JC074 TaxID=2530199 RepID=UPI001F0EC211|nr:deoxynucleoside kinase [Acidaminobacter sp. JC074]MCH4889773.1 deoxynucleoside kinase [Acidaminobacter sp. JC074]
MYISSIKENYANKVNEAIIIDGIIGAGKTTVGRLLSDHYKLPFFEEIKDESQASLVQRMLDRFYDNPKRWSFATQVMFLTQRFKDIKHIQANDLKGILDRSIYGDEIFSRTVLKRKQMTLDEFQVYQDLLKNMLQVTFRPKLLIYLDVSVDTAMDRIRKRNRSTEAQMIPRDYMEDLKEAYDKWFETYDLSPKLKIDFNHDCISEDNWHDCSQDELIALIDGHYKKTTLTSC